VLQSTSTTCGSHLHVVVLLRPFLLMCCAAITGFAFDTLISSGKELHIVAVHRHSLPTGARSHDWRRIRQSHHKNHRRPSETANLGHGTHCRRRRRRFCNDAISLNRFNSEFVSAHRDSRRPVRRSSDRLHGRTIVALLDVCWFTTSRGELAVIGARSLTSVCIVRRETFEHVTTWLEDCRKYSSRDITIMLIGNKVGECLCVHGSLQFFDQVDLEEQRQVTYEEAQKFATDHDLAFFEVIVVVARCVPVRLSSKGECQDSASDRYGVHRERQQDLRKSETRASASSALCVIITCVLHRVDFGNANTGNLR
jgi:hypothetical protein